LRNNKFSVKKQENPVKLLPMGPESPYPLAV